MMKRTEVRSGDIYAKRPIERLNISSGGWDATGISAEGSERR